MGDLYRHHIQLMYQYAECKAKHSAIIDALQAGLK